MKEQEILRLAKDKLGIDQLNPMQRQVISVSTPSSDMIIYSPTGTGKTLAYTLPVLKALKNFEPEKLQVVVIAPSRELVSQIYQVVRQLAVGFKVSCSYGGHNVFDEKRSLATEPSILVATPGRLLDHVRRNHVSITNVRQLVIDEFDKCLELGFEEEMESLCKLMPNLSRRILTSATVLSSVPEYVHLNDEVVVDYLDGSSQLKERLKIWNVISDDKDKIFTLQRLLLSLPDGKSIVFVNYRETVERLYGILNEHHISAGAYHGALEQIDREKAIAMFNNGSFKVLVTTDLGARGLDIDAVKHIIHYHMPITPEAYTHRNGRTARVEATGSIYILQGPEEELPSYIEIDNEYHIPSELPRTEISSSTGTIFFMAGKKEKISRGDILGFIAKNTSVPASEIGHIDVYDHHSLVAVPQACIRSIITQLTPIKIKGQKVRMSIAHPDARPSKIRMKRF